MLYKKNLALSLLIVIVFFASCGNSAGGSGVSSESNDGVSNSGNQRTPPSSPYKKIGVVTIGSVTYDIVTFGSWPQTIKQSGVTVDESESSKITVGEFDYYPGSDGGWYVKKREDGNKSDGNKYSDGSSVMDWEANSYRWFKVEPIKWRVLTYNYDHDKKESTAGVKLLLAESVLTTGDVYDGWNTGARGKDNGKDIVASNYKYSRIRAYLNGGSYKKQKMNSNDSTTVSFSGKGFLQTAFNNSERLNILETTVDNSERSTNTDRNPKEWNEGVNDRACENSKDSVFLLSIQELTKKDYGFSEDPAVNDTVRIKNAMDYSKSCKVTGLGNDSTRSWWHRSPASTGYIYCRGDVGMNGRVRHDAAGNGGNKEGVVPALCVKN